MFRFVSFRCRARVLCASAGLVALSTAPTSAITLDDITIWTGSGENRAGLVIDWVDGKSPAVYGYRFDGAASGQDMFEAIFADRTELYAKVAQFGFGDSALGIGMDRDADGFSISDGTTTTPGADFTDGILITTTANADGNTAVDTDDSYAEGWNTGFFGYYVSDGASDWGFASSGFGGRALTDGAWDGYAYAPGFSGSAPNVSVPEPTSAVLLGLAGLAVLRRRRG